MDHSMSHEPDEPVEFDGVVVKLTPDALLVLVDVEEEVWLPLSQIEDLQPEVEHLSVGDDVSGVIPLWLAAKKWLA